LPPQDKESLRDRFLTQFSELRGRRNLLFLSRIHPKKGCDILIRAFARIAARQPEVSLVMAGPDSNQWMPELKRLASELRVADRIFWPGMLQGELKWGAFYASEAFILPSHQENFGIAVAEALGCGLPVLISDKVNIWREIRDDRAGLVDTDDDDGTYRNMNSWFEMPASERSAMGARASETYRRRFTVQSMADTLLELAHEPKVPTELGVKT
jgi:glycosyltransferase involved in cell wall biosynthesis